MVSVIIPTYNYAEYLPEALNSVLGQSYSDWECIVIDNGSTDNTHEVIQQFLSDPRFQYVRQDNLGVSAARNAGLKLAKGAFIQFLDADDLIEKQKLQASADYLQQHPAVDLVYSDMRYFKTGQINKLFYNYACSESDDKPWMNYLSGSGLPVTEQFLKGNNFVISAPVFRKDILKEIGFFDETLQYNEDWDFWFRMVLAGKAIQYMAAEEIRTLIRIHTKSASKDVFKMHVCGLKVLLKNSTAIQKSGLIGPLQLRIDAHLRMIRQLLIESSGSIFKEKIQVLHHAGISDQVVGKGLGNETILKLKLKLLRFLNLSAL